MAHPWLMRAIPSTGLFVILLLGKLQNTCRRWLTPLAGRQSNQGSHALARPSITLAATGLSSSQPVDGLGECNVALRDTTGIVTGQPEIDAVPDARELGVVVDL